jgi:hypothetical protein
VNLDLFSQHLLYAFAKSRGAELFSAVRERVGDDALREIHRRLQEANPFEPAPLDTLVAALGRAGGGDYKKVIDEWYHAKGLADLSTTGFRAECIEGLEGPSYHVRYLVRNSGTRDTRFYTRSLGRNPSETLVVTHEIAAGEYMEVCAPVIDCGRTACVYVDCDADANIPSSIYHYAAKFEPVAGEVTFGTRPADASLFDPDPLEIIVDDRDPGFSIVTRRQSLFGKRGHAWQERTSAGAYGKGVRTYRCIHDATGTSFAVWKAEIAEAGAYDLYVFIPNEGFLVNSRKPMMYAVTPPGSAPEVTPLAVELYFQGWKLLGRFDLQPGTAVVTLSEKIDEEPGRIYEVKADAIKWRRALE